MSRLPAWGVRWPQGHLLFPPPSPLSTGVNLQMLCYFSFEFPLKLLVNFLGSPQRQHQDAVPPRTSCHILCSSPPHWELMVLQRRFSVNQQPPRPVPSQLPGGAAGLADLRSD